MSDMTVARTIQAQIGGKALYMIGASNLMGDDKSLQFKIGCNGKGVTHIRVTLADSDTYKVEFIRVRGLNVKPVHTSEGVYADSLRTVIEAHTGLATSLGPVTYGGTRLA